MSNETMIEDSTPWFNKLKPTENGPPYQPHPEDWGVYADYTGSYCWRNTNDHLYYLQDVARYQQAQIAMLQESLKSYVREDDTHEDGGTYAIRYNVAKEILKDEYNLVVRG